MSSQRTTRLTAWSGEGIQAAKHPTIGIRPPPLWKCMEDFFTHCSKWPLVEISKEEQVNNLNDALTFRNHKGALAKPKLLLKLISKDVKYGYSVPIPLDSVKLIPGLEMAPMNIMAQNTINKFGQVIPKDQLTHNQSWKWSSGTSVNSHVWRELLQECRYSFCIRRIMKGSGSKEKISWLENPSIKN
jgi:hypothetical protein